jgi:hypothetical protein
MHIRPFFLSGRQHVLIYRRRKWPINGEHKLKKTLLKVVIVKHEDEFFLAKGDIIEQVVGNQVVFMNE